MKIVHFSSTKLKKDTAEILNLVAYGGAEAVIERHGKPIARVVPTEEKFGESISEVIDRYFGAMPDFPNVTKLRRSRRRKVPPLL